MKGGGRAKDARFEAPEAPMGWSVGRGVPSPLKKASGEGAVPPPQKLKKIFWFNVFKKFLCSGQGGGIAQWPTLNTPLLLHLKRGWPAETIALGTAAKFAECTEMWPPCNLLKCSRLADPDPSPYWTYSARSGHCLGQSKSRSKSGSESEWDPDMDLDSDPNLDSDLDACHFLCNDRVSFTLPHMICISSVTIAL